MNKESNNYLSQILKAVIHEYPLEELVILWQKGDKNEDIKEGWKIMGWKCTRANRKSATSGIYDFLDFETETYYLALQ